MNVAQYTFQSPYPSQVQVGRPDTSSQRADVEQKDSSELLKNTNTSLSNAKIFQITQTEEVKPTVSSSHLLDTYA